MNEQLKQILDHPATIPTGVGVLSFCAGLGAGYILAKRKSQINEEPHEQLELNFNVTEALDEVAPDEPVVSKKQKTEEELSIQLEGTRSEVDEYIREKLGEEIEDAILTSDDDSEEELLTIENVFGESDDDDWDLVREQLGRSSKAPYVLHKDEFWAEELNYTQTTLTYYTGDDILCDEDDTPVYNHQTIIGELKFGHGSGDPNVFYIRNDKLRAEYEIIRVDGLYSEEVMGLEIENNQRIKDLKHSKDRKFRME